MQNTSNSLQTPAAPSDWFTVAVDTLATQSEDPGTESELRHVR